MDIAAEKLCFDFSIDMLGGWIIAALTGERVGSAIDMVTETATSVGLISLTPICLVSCAADVRAGVIIDVLVCTVAGAVSVIDIEAFARVDVSMWASTTTGSDSIATLLSIEETFLFGCEACTSCCTTAAWNCRSLQTWTPSRHV